MQVVYVEWLDASTSSGFRSIAAAQREGLILMQSTGSLVGEDDQVLRLAQDYFSYDDDGSPTERCRSLIVIPKAAIQRRQQWDTAPPPLLSLDETPVKRSESAFHASIN